MLQKAQETLRGFIYWTVHKRIRTHVYIPSQRKKKYPVATPSHVTVRNYGMNTAIYHLQRLNEEEHCVRQKKKKIALFCSFATACLLSSFLKTIIDLNFSFSSFLLAAYCMPHELSSTKCDGFVVATGRNALPRVACCKKVHLRSSTFIVF